LGWAQRTCSKGIELLGGKLHVLVVGHVDGIAREEAPNTLATQVGEGGDLVQASALDGARAQGQACPGYSYSGSEHVVCRGGRIRLSFYTIESSR
jgi:hypothetical protein